MIEDYPQPIHTLDSPVSGFKQGMTIAEASKYSGGVMSQCLKSDPLPCVACGGSHDHARPKGYSGRLYNDITILHRDYLRALADACCASRGPVTEMEWLRACWERGVRTNEGKPPSKISTFMVYGVFAYHKLADINKGRPFSYMITDLGKANT